jgi:hypothetical protein
MVRLRVLLAIAALAVAVSAVGGARAATSAANPIADCNSTGSLTHRYPAAVLQRALKTMPADIKEYTNCYDVIQRALLAQVSGRHADGSAASRDSGGAVLPAWVIVVLVLLVLAAAAFGAMALRRRGGGRPGDRGGPPAAGGSPPAAGGSPPAAGGGSAGS